MISHHWVKEIDSDSSVNASSLWFNGKKLLTSLQLLQQKENSCVGELHRNIWRSFPWRTELRLSFSSH